MNLCKFHVYKLPGHSLTLLFQHYLAKQHCGKEAGPSVIRVSTFQIDRAITIADLQFIAKLFFLQDNRDE